jgi:Secretion system C-terminal sorting domain
MKLFVNALLLFLLPILAQSQSIDRQVLASSGNFVENSTASLSYTVGESVIILGSNGSNVLTQGYQQPNVVLTTTTGGDCSFLFYPNPLIDYMSITSTVTDTSFEIFDVLGRSYGFFKQSNNEIDVSFLSTGLYFIKINCGTQKAQYHKFVKQ